MKNEKLLVIGGVAAGTKAASKARRENPNLEITILTKDEYISYAGCGLPYFIGEVIAEKRELLVRTPEDFKREQNIDVLIKHQAVKIDKENKKVYAIDLNNSENKVFEYDKLIIATGARPIVPELPGKDLKNIFTVRSVNDAFTMRERVSENKVQKAVVIGGGFIGLEMAENLKEKGIEVTVIELADHILPSFDAEMALYAQNYLIEQGVAVQTNEEVVAFKGNDKGKVTAVITDQKEYSADLVVLSMGVIPNSEIAKEAGIELGYKNTIAVNEYMETNVKDIYAVGDVAQNINLISRKSVWYPMGSTANKMGRIAGANVVHGPVDKLDGVLGTTVVKLFELNAAKTGLSQREAVELGYKVKTILVPGDDIAHYYPGYRKIYTKLIIDTENHKILGGQVIGTGVVDKPIDILVTAITLGATYEMLSKLDLAYAPPFSTAMCTTIVSSNVLHNVVTDRVIKVNSIELQELMKNGNVQVIDIRTEPEYMICSIPGAVHLPKEEILERLDELDIEKLKVLVCNVGKAAFLTYLKLKNAGIQNIAILEGGLSCYPFETL